jgi:hypothetical protein
MQKGKKRIFIVEILTVQLVVYANIDAFLNQRSAQAERNI